MRSDHVNSAHTGGAGANGDGAPTADSGGSADGNSAGKRKSKLRDKFDHAASAMTPLPLRLAVTPPMAYPAHAFGATASVVNAIATVAQADLALAGGSVLAAGALAASGHVDVLHPVLLSPKPVTSYFLGIAESGDRKSVCDEQACKGIVLAETKLASAYDAAKVGFDTAMNVYAGAVRQIVPGRKHPLGKGANGTLTAVDCDNLLKGMVKPVLPPRGSLRTADTTIEGLLKHWHQYKPVHGIFTTEGGLFVAGAAMSRELRMSTVAMMSKLWDDGTAERKRAGADEPIEVRNKRLSCSLMLQPNFVSGFLGDINLRQQGIVARLLTASPESRMGKRPLYKPTQKDRAEIDSFARRIDTLLSWPAMPLEANGKGSALKLSIDAYAAWAAYYNKVDQLILGPLRFISSSAARSAEHALRIAGILEVINGGPISDIHEIGADAMNGAVELAWWYLGEMLRITENMGASDLQVNDAADLLDWLRDNPDKRQLGTIMQFAPRRFRNKATLERLLGVLEDHCWIDWPDGQGYSKAFRMLG